MSTATRTSTRSKAVKVSTATSFLVAEELDPDSSIASDDDDFSYDEDDQTYTDDEVDAVIEKDEIRQPQFTSYKLGSHVFKKPAKPASDPEEDAYIAARALEIEEEYQQALRKAEKARENDASRQVVDSDGDSDEDGDVEGEKKAPSSVASSSSLRSSSSSAVRRSASKGSAPGSAEDSLTKKVKKMALA